MTESEARMLVECEIRTRWMTWKPSPQMIEDLIFAIKPYDNQQDVVNAIKAYRNSNSGTSPKVDALVAEIKKAVGTRKKVEHETGPEWAGQAFVVVHHAADGSEDGIWHWHIGDYRKEIPYERQSFVLEGHVHYCQTRFSDRYPAGGHFTGEVHNEDSFSKRLREVNLQMSSPEVKKRVAEVEDRLFSGEAPGQIFHEMFRCIEEKAKVPFHRSPRANPLLPDVRPPSSVEEELPPFMAEEPGEVIHDDPEPTPEPAPKPKKENPRADWLDETIQF